MIVKEKSVTSFWSIKLQEHFSCLCCIAMMAGLLFSRSLLSAAMILMLINACHPAKVVITWTSFKHNIFAQASVAFFSVYLFSGLWSSNADSWLMAVQIKLPFIFLPFSMLSLPLQVARYRKMVMWGILMVLVGGMCYSFYFLLADPAYLHKNHHLPSPSGGDYIRFTIALVLALQFIFYMFMERGVHRLTTWEKAGLLVFAITIVVYIHVQAAKSGLLCLYILFFIYALFIFLKRGKIFLLSAFLCLATIGMLAVLFVPSLQKQISNITYEQQVWQTNDTTKYNETSSFVPRLISYKIAGQLVKEHPLTGVGAGDMKLAMDQKYAVQYPNIKKIMWLIPHNQFLCTAISVGIPLSAILWFMLLAPLAVTRMRIYTVATIVIMFVGLMIEPMLEIQYGIFVYLFFTLFWVVALKKQRFVRKKLHYDTI